MSGPMSGPVYPELRAPGPTVGPHWRAWCCREVAWPRYMIAVFAVLFTWGGLTLGLALGIEDKPEAEIDRPVKIGRTE